MDKFIYQNTLNEEDSQQDIIFINSDTVIVENKYIIRSKGDKYSKVFTLNNINRHWESNIAFNVRFDNADLENITENEELKAQILEFSIYAQELYLGKLMFCFKHSTKYMIEEFIKFLNCSPLNENYLKLKMC